MAESERRQEGTKELIDLHSKVDSIILSTSASNQALGEPSIIAEVPGNWATSNKQTTDKAILSAGRLQKRDTVWDESLSDEDVFSNIEKFCLDLMMGCVSKRNIGGAYRGAYSLVLRRKGSILYTRLMDTIDSHLAKVLTTQIKPLLIDFTPGLMPPDTDQMQKREKDFQSSVIQQWEMFRRSLGMLTDLFMYLEKVIATSSSLQSIYDAGSAKFRSIILESDDVRPFLPGILSGLDQMEV